MRKLAKHKAKKIVFFIGTIAELIKVFPVIREFKLNEIEVKIIFSGQNDIRISDLYQYVQDFEIIDLSRERITQSPLGLASWFIKTLIKGYNNVSKTDVLDKNSVVLVHGDTVSTLMGALLGRLRGAQVAHIEAGLRSYNNFQPFPEEITRVIVSKLANIHFCPNDWARNNLHNAKGKKINTEQNTAYDSLQFALKNTPKNTLRLQLKPSYFVFVLHRQENLLNEDLVRTLIEETIELSKKKKCLFILHAVTKVQLEKYGLLEKITSNKNIITVDRLPYFIMIDSIQHADFIITDGGSNQEESYYLGIPCLLLRNVSERVEGLDQNVVLSYNDKYTIRSFFTKYSQYKKKQIKVSTSPSKIITNYFLH